MYTHTHTYLSKIPNIYIYIYILYVQKENKSGAALKIHMICRHELEKTRAWSDT